MNNIVPFFLLIFLTACTTSSSLYNFDYPLTNQTAESQYMDLSVKIPQDWSAVEDNECYCIDILLINKEKTASIKFVPINVDSLVLSNDDKLEKILTFSKKFREIALRDKFNQIDGDEFFTIGSLKCAAYKYLNEEKIIVRVIVFSFNKKYFESIATPVSYESIAKDKLSRLFNVQNSTLLSISSR
ncbi:hypothetical protein ABRY23_13525 [Melioribacteraceae bacterium 4301-Me]|uniref:hypothetical protein n=1 Tax=Pyranulibacter aquaticus TaxID=3163344 RepID=UPI0035971F04